MFGHIHLRPGARNYLETRIFFPISRMPNANTNSMGLAHPVLVRCANVPMEMWNSEDVDGGHLVGWLLIICDKTWMLHT